MTRQAMNDAVGLLASAIGLILVPICLVRLVLGRADFTALYRAPGGEAWPQGVQEQDCPRWRLGGAQSKAPPKRVTLPGVHGDGVAELLVCTVDDMAALDPAATRPARGLLVPRTPVRGRVGLTGGAAARARGRPQPRAGEHALALDHA
jgi:hypothetical protein